jgi:hypothetical protein
MLQLENENGKADPTDAYVQYVVVALSFEAG